MSFRTEVSKDEGQTFLPHFDEWRLDGHFSTFQMTKNDFVIRLVKRLSKSKASKSQAK